MDCLLWFPELVSFSELSWESLVTVPGNLPTDGSRAQLPQLASSGTNSNKCSPSVCLHAHEFLSPLASHKTIWLTIKGVTTECWPGFSLHGPWPSPIVFCLTTWKVRWKQNPEWRGNVNQHCLQYSTLSDWMSNQHCLQCRVITSLSHQFIVPVNTLIWT